MDHLHIPEACKPQAVRVPYSGFAPKYDRLGFNGFPGRYGQNIDELTSPDDLNPRRKEWVESFFQEWLWFGVMDEFTKACDIDLDLNVFIVDNPSDSGRLINTTALISQGTRKSPRPGFGSTSGVTVGFNLARGMFPEYAPFTAAATRGPQGLKKPTGRRLKLAEALESGLRVLRAIERWSSPLLRYEIILSVDILCDSIARIMRDRFGEYIASRSATSSQTFEDVMIARNWCPSRITPVLTQASVSSNYIASLLPSYEPESHRGCRPRKCLKRTSTLEGIPPLHRDTCLGDCSDVSTEESQTIKTWKNGGIPGFRLQPDVKLGRLEIVDCAKHSFVAISHVWAHGMGNSFKNSLPTCQIEFLFDLVRQVAGRDAVLWIDPLSVPIDPEAKRIAITHSASD